MYGEIQYEDAFQQSLKKSQDQSKHKLSENTKTVIHEQAEWNEYKYDATNKSPKHPRGPKEANNLERGNTYLSYQST